MEIVPLFCGYEEQILDAALAEGVVAGEHLGQHLIAEAVPADVAAQELLLEAVLIEHHAALVEGQGGP